MSSTPSSELPLFTVLASLRVSRNVRPKEGGPRPRPRLLNRHYFSGGAVMSPTLHCPAGTGNLLASAFSSHRNAFMSFQYLSRVQRTSSSRAARCHHSGTGHCRDSARAMGSVTWADTATGLPSSCPRVEDSPAVSCHGGGRRVPPSARERVLAVGLAPRTGRQARAQP